MKTSLAQTAKAVTFQNAHPEAVWRLAYLTVDGAERMAVDLPVRRAVDSAVWGPVHEAVHPWPVESAVGSAVGSAVSGTLDL